MEFPPVDMSSQSDGRAEVVNNGRAEDRVEVISQESSGAVGEKVAAVEGSDESAALGAGLETNCVSAGGEKTAASDGSDAGADVGAASETDVVSTGEGVAAVKQMQGGTIYCHQCHQDRPRTGATPACKGGSRNKGNCRLTYCKRCIQNRYNWIADEELKEETWECPKCRNRCNCSVCQRKKGEAPTGPMVCPGRKRKGSVDDTPANNKKPRLRAENTDVLEEEIDLPRGTLLTCVAGVELQPEDVGGAIQFLEFCRLFGKIFEIRDEQPAQTIKDITIGRQLREVPSVVADLHIKLLSVIEKAKAKACEYPRHGDEWIRKVGKYVANSILDAKDFTLDCLNQGVSGYKNLTPSSKLDLLNCLCDEALSSEWENRESVAREKIGAATKKEKELKQRHKYLTKPTDGGETTSNEEIENLISEIKKENAVKKEAVNELEELGHFLKTTPVKVNKGVAYWNLDGYCNNNTNIMRQDFDDENTVKNKDKRFIFTEDEQKVIEDHLTKRSRRPSRNRYRV